MDEEKNYKSFIKHKSALVIMMANLGIDLLEHSLINKKRQALKDIAKTDLEKYSKFYFHTQFYIVHPVNDTFKLSNYLT